MTRDLPTSQLREKARAAIREHDCSSQRMVACGCLKIECRCGWTVEAPERQAKDALDAHRADAVLAAVAERVEDLRDLAKTLDLLLSELRAASPEGSQP